MYNSQTNKNLITNSDTLRDYCYLRLKGWLGEDGESVRYPDTWHCRCTKRVFINKIIINREECSVVTSLEGINVNFNC